MKKGYVFSIINTMTGEQLILSTINYMKCKQLYQKRLNNGEFHNQDLQRDYSIWGKDNFEFKLLEVVIDEDLTKVKNKYIDLFKTMKIGYNRKLQH